jgi:hypothetical protein
MLSGECGTKEVGFTSGVNVEQINTLSVMIIGRIINNRRSVVSGCRPASPPDRSDLHWQSEHIPSGKKEYSRHCRCRYDNKRVTIVASLFC